MEDYLRRLFTYALLDLKDSLEDYLFDFHRDPGHAKFLSRRVKLDVDEVARCQEELRKCLEVEMNRKLAGPEVLNREVVKMLDAYKLIEQGRLNTNGPRRSNRVRRTPKRL